jgi:hypothetical protein
MDIELDLGRVFWIAYIAVAAVFTLIGVLDVATGRFGETEFQILITALLALLAAGALYAGLAVIGRGGAWLGGVAVAAAPLEFGVVTHAIWADHRSDTSDKWAATLFVTLLAGLIVCTLRLLVQFDLVVVRASFLASSLCLGAAAVIVIKLIWGEHDQVPADAKTGTAFLVLAVFGYLFTPALQRLVRTEG